MVTSAWIGGLRHGHKQPQSQWLKLQRAFFTYATCSLLVTWGPRAHAGSMCLTWALLATAAEREKARGTTVCVCVCSCVRVSVRACVYGVPGLAEFSSEPCGIAEPLSQHQLHSRDMLRFLFLSQEAGSSSKLEAASFSSHCPRARPQLGILPGPPLMYTELNCPKGGCE